MDKVTMVVNGKKYRAEVEYGGWFEADDPTPSGSIGRTMMHMNTDGSADLNSLGEIEVAYEDA